jgi:hypothetical protein
MELGLVEHDELEMILLTGGPVVTNILLKELLCKEDALRLNVGRAWMEVIAIEL